jgi:hypothetical protein
MTDRRRGGRWERLVFGTVVLGAGVLFWLDQMERINARDYLRWWPLAALAMGAAHLLDRKWFGAAIWIVTGAYFSLPLLGLAQVPFWRIIGLWPLLISFGGITLMQQALRRRAVGSEVHAVAVMSGNNRGVGSQRFAGGDVVAVMGGCEIDLTSAQIVGEAVLDVLAFWGGVEIRVPRGWKVVGHVIPILGGYEDKTASAPENAPRLIVRGSAIMGGIEVRNPRETTG